MPSVIFCTLNGGCYDDHWLSEPDAANTRSLHWCGQRKNKGNKDALVEPGTLVAVRRDSSCMHFAIVGQVVTKSQLTTKTPTTCATYKLSVSLYENYIRIDKAVRDRCTHWSVLRYLRIPQPRQYIPEGIYSA